MTDMSPSSVQAAADGDQIVVTVIQSLMPENGMTDGKEVE